MPVKRIFVVSAHLRQFLFRTVLGIAGASCFLLGVAQATPYSPNLLPSADYNWIYQGVSNLGLQSDGLVLYAFHFTFENLTSNPLQSIYAVIPPDPALSFGVTTPTWNSATQEWEGYSTVVNDTIVAKPYGYVGYLDPTTPQYPIYSIASYVAPNATINDNVDFELDPRAGYFSFNADVAVPSPPTIVLFASGLLGLGFVTRKRRRSAAA